MRIVRRFTKCPTRHTVAKISQIFHGIDRTLLLISSRAFFFSLTIGYVQQTPNTRIGLHLGHRQTILLRKLPVPSIKLLTMRHRSRLLPSRLRPLLISIYQGIFILPRRRVQVSPSRVASRLKLSHLSHSLLIRHSLPSVAVTVPHSPRGFPQNPRRPTLLARRCRQRVNQLFGNTPMIILVRSTYVLCSISNIAPSRKVTLLLRRKAKLVHYLLKGGLACRPIVFIDTLGITISLLKLRNLCSS